jgi:hypothetical protein
MSEKIVKKLSKILKSSQKIIKKSKNRQKVCKNSETIWRGIWSRLRLKAKNVSKSWKKVVQKMSKVFKKN